MMVTSLNRLKLLNDGQDRVSRFHLSTNMTDILLEKKECVN